MNVAANLQLLVHRQTLTDDLQNSTLYNPSNISAVKPTLILQFHIYFQCLLRIEALNIYRAEIV